MWRFLLLAAGLDLSCGAALRARRVASSEEGSTAEDKKVPKEDLVDMLTSYMEVDVGIIKEQATFKELSEAREKSCQELESTLKKSIVEGEATIKNAKAELERAKSEVDSMQGSMDGITKQMKVINGEIEGLQKQLATLRKDRAGVIARDNAYNQEVKVILEKAQERIETVWTRTKAKEEKPAAKVEKLSDDAEKQAKSEVAELLGSNAKKSLFELEAVRSEDAQDELTTLDAGLVSAFNPVSFLQLDVDESEFSVEHESKRSLSEGDAPSSEAKKALEKDKEDVKKGAEKAREAFQDEEIKIMEKVKKKRKELEPWEAKLAERQPGLADQLRKISEANRTMILTSRGIEADKKVIESAAKKCATMSQAKDFEGKQRPKVDEQVKLVIDSLRQLGKELKYDLPESVLPKKKEGAFFLQLSSESEEAEPTEAPIDTEPAHITKSKMGFDLKGMMQQAAGSDVEVASSGLAPEGASMLQRGEASKASEAPIDFGIDLKGMMQQAAGNQVESASSSAASEGASMLQSGEDSGKAREDPLKGVKTMITNLIDALQQEQNEEKKKQAFCAEQEAKAAESATKARGNLKTKEQQKRWAENAVLDLQAEINFLNTEVDRLKRTLSAGKSDLDAEKKRIEDEGKNHKQTNTIGEKAMEVLKTHCGKEPAGTCGTIVGGLGKVADELKVLDEFLAKYVLDFAKITEAQKDEIEKTLKTQEPALAEANTNYNRRKDEFAQLNLDVQNAKNAIGLAGEAESALDKSCGQEVHSLEDVVARRKEEIRQMKTAIAVLDGEAFR